MYRTTAKGCSGYSPKPWYIDHIPQTPEVPYCYYKLVTNVIRAVKIQYFVIPAAVSQSAFRVRTTQFIIIKGYQRQMGDASLMATHSLISALGPIGLVVGHNQWSLGCYVSISNPVDRGEFVLDLYLAMS
jgi:hypothetical protein